MPQKIHLIFKTHLDVGFTNYAAAVVQNYFTNYIPAAMHVARTLRDSGRPERFIWTTGSWLIYQFLEQAAPAQRKQMEDAILAGDLSWHALPFTTHTELMDVDLFHFGLSLSQQLDQRFGKRTIAAKLTDVPGHTRGIIPLLAEAGVQFLHLGVNGSSTLPQLPPIFRWQNPSTTGHGEEIIVMVESGYGNAFTVSGIEDSLAFSHTSDNLGPQTSDQVVQAYQEAQNAHPGAQVFASTLDAFAAALVPVRASLPLVTQEIGDTWIHGVGSDPVKVSQFRELLRLRTAWLQADHDLGLDPQYNQFLHYLLQVPEHTWGMDEKTFLGDHENYSKTAFNANRSKENFRNFEASWSEQRALITKAVDALGDASALTLAARERLESIRPVEPDLSHWQAISSDDQTLNTAHFQIRFDPLNGALNSLVTLPDQRVWADAGHPLGRLRYQSFSAADYERFFMQYIRPEERHNDWCSEDFTKPGLESADPQSRMWQPLVIAQYIQKSDANTRILFYLKGVEESVERYGCPRDFYLQYTFPTAQARVEIDLQWFNKPASRLPEAVWFQFRPLVSPAAEWRMEKLGQTISPLEVVPYGGRQLHAVGREVTCTDQSGILRILPLDAPLVAPGEPSLLNFTDAQPDMSAGVHFNLYNNVWGTNFPMWFEEDCRFRFELDFA